MGECGYSALSTSVWVHDGDSLILVGIIAYDAFGEDVKWLAKQDLVGWQANDVDLEVEHDSAYQEWDVVC